MAAETPSAPDHLSEGARALYARIREECVIDAAADEILISLCDAWDRRRQAREAMQETGPVMKDRFGVQKASPWVAIERDATLIMHRAFRLLGFDQEARGGSDQQKLFS